MISHLMDCFQLIVFFLVLLLSTYQYANGDDGAIHFDQNYYQTFGDNHLTILEQGLEVQLLIDQYKGAGFSSKEEFGSGYFGTSIKIPNKNSTGINTSFYLMSIPVGQPVGGVDHFEFDFEFFGTYGNPYILSTNVFANDLGGKEQLFHLWFDPTRGFHTYEILWNQHQIVWFVDRTPIRVWKNNTNLGVGFPTVPMHLEASIWNPSWLGNVNWTSQGPLFTANYRGFAIQGCTYKPSNPHQCYEETYYWNRKQYSRLNPYQETKLEKVRKSYMYQDYCNDQSRHGPECPINR